MSPEMCAWSLKLQIVHAFLDRERKPEIKILNMFSIIFRLCIANFIFSCQKKAQVPLKSYFFLLKIGQSGHQNIQTCRHASKYPDMQENWRKNAPKKENFKKVQSLREKKVCWIPLFPVHFFWNNPSDLKSAKKFWIFSTPILTSFVKKKITLVLFWQENTESAIQKLKINQSFFSILVSGFYLLYQNVWKNIILKRSKTLHPSVPVRPTDMLNRP